MDRVDPPLRAEEVATLLGFLDYQRATLRQKVSGLDAAALQQPLPPSSMTLGGLVSHLDLVEDNWFSVVLAGGEPAPHWAEVDWDADRDHDWHVAAGRDLPALLATYDETVARSDRCIATALDGPDGLDTVSVRVSRRTGEGKYSLRWILLHMIEEYARHNGHADLLREAVDGQVGE